MEVAITGIVIAAIALAVTILGGLMATGRAHINRRVDVKLEAAVTGCVAEHMKVIDLKLDTIALNVLETSVAVGKVHQLEILIRNGLDAKVTRMEDDLAELRRHLMWDGKERRNGDTN